MFVNGNASGIFIVQYGNDFQYLDSAKQVIAVIKSRFNGSYTTWIY